jgi:hypothetical protein
MFLLVYLGEGRVYYPGPGPKGFLKIEVFLQFSLPGLMEMPTLGSFLKKDEMLYWSGGGVGLNLGVKGGTV